MVKKIQGGPASPTTGVQPTRGVEVGKTGAVSQVKAAQAQSGVKGTEGVGAAITAANREVLLKLLGDESEKMFGKNLPEKTKEKLEKAVRMTIDATVTEEE